MPRSRPASNPLSFHKPTGQYYVTRLGKRIYLGANQEEALAKYHSLALGPGQATQPKSGPISAKELVNRFIVSQEANWRNPKATLSGYRGWLGRFLADHPGLAADQFTLEMFAAWKLSLKKREYSPRSVNHFLSAVRAVFLFGEEAGLIEKMPRLGRIRNELRWVVRATEKPLYTAADAGKLLQQADETMRAMMLMALNCGFGPKDIQDLTWENIVGERVTLPRSKTGVCQTFLLWPETQAALTELKRIRAERMARTQKRGSERSDGGHIFVTKFWRPWNKDAVAEEFRKLCEATGIECYGFYRLRHCASTAMSLVAMPHVQRKFMRHTEIQQQVTYTHVPDAEVDTAIGLARTRLLADGLVIASSGNSRELAGAGAKA